jgi:hypothetical protein
VKLRLLILIILVCFLSVVFYPLKYTFSQGPANCPPDKELCAKMLRFGKQAYSRGKYLDAKEYFRKAVKADPTSTTAWVYYDQAVIFGLAEKVEKNANLVLPDVSDRQETGASLPSEAPPAPPEPTAEKQPSGFVIVDDEGC